MAITNYERIGKGLELLKQGLGPFVEREMKAVFGNKWIETARYKLLRDEDLQVVNGEIQWDVHVLLILMWEFWHDVFKRTLSQNERNYVSELRTVRNNWAHQQFFSSDDTERALDSMRRLLTSISAEEALEVDRMRRELMRTVIAEQARQELRKKATSPVQGSPRAGLKPWREIMTPHPDIQSGRYQQAEFAADLAQVHRREASSEYGDPVEFFQRTYLTEGIKQLLSDAIRRLSAKGGNPVIELQTNFGGGKTHSLLALYHLFSGVSPSQLPEVEDLMREVGEENLPKVRRAVIVGTALSPGQPWRKDDETTVKTLWGELAWQLGEREAFESIKAADSSGTSPGSEDLLGLFKKYGPALILIDEWVAFVRQLWDKREALPAGSFDSNITFAQALCEAARAVPNCMVVLTLPASRIEVGGEGGQEGLAQLKHTVGRIESPWRPASQLESFEIVRRRLFQPISDPELFKARDAVVESFSRMYRQDMQEFPQGAGEGDYQRLLRDAYPIHPQLFSMLYESWSSLEKFQRTRGVLRLMASVIHQLWQRGDSNLIIMPGTVPLDSGEVQKELMHYLPDHWAAVIEKDVDGPNSLPLEIDGENNHLGRFSACRRVARSIFLGSAPTAESPNPGIDERQIKLGCVQPGETVATFGDALRRLVDRATHLYVDQNRYWLSTQPSVTQLARDRAAQLDSDRVHDEIKRRLRADRERGDFSRVHMVPDTPADVPEEADVRLVVLAPEHAHRRGDETSKARQEAAKILESRGASPRLYRNTLVFLAADQTRLEDLEAATRQYLAWSSVVEDERQERLDLTTHARSQARTQRENADQTVTHRIQETFVWLLVPSQPDPGQPAGWVEIRLQGLDPLAVRASKKLVAEEGLILEYAPTRLRMDLDRYLWKESNHLFLKKLQEYLITYLYLPRLKDSQVLLRCIQNGVASPTWTENFAYAEGWDEERKRYRGLKAGTAASVLIDHGSLIVKPDAALAQMKEERLPDREGETDDKETAIADWESEGIGLAQEENSQAERPKLRRFFGSVHLDATRLNRDVDRIAQEVIRHLNTQPHARVEISLEVKAEIPDGAPEKVIRTVKENCETLKFDTYGFDEE